jgi:ammonium transporter, Amt family
MGPPTPVISESTTALCLIFILLIPLAAGGLALISNGLGKSHNAAHAMLAAMCVIAVAAIVYIAIGFSWEGFPGRATHVITVGGKPWDWIARQPFFLRGLELNGSPASLAVLLQMFAVGIAGVIPLSAAADRWRLGAICASTAVLAGWTYPLFAHWVWGGGWLAQLGTNYGLGSGFLDTGGAGTIQVVGGLTALSMVWILGPRQGKYSSDGMPTGIPGHNLVNVVFGCLLAWVGWLGLNSAGAMLFGGTMPVGLVVVEINTTLCAAASALMAAVVTRIRFGRPDASISANGWVGGLVASSAATAMLRPATAILVGLVAGTLVALSVEWLELWLAVDDPGGAVSAHALAGIWGLFAAGLFANLGSPSAAPGQWLAQFVGIATLLGFVLPLSYSLNWLLGRITPHRVDSDGERQGMDLHELGAGAYPEFMIHSDEFIQR